MVARIKQPDALPPIVKIASDLEKGLYKIFTENGIAAACLKTYYPAMSVEQITEAMTIGFAQSLLQRMQIPSDAFNGLTRGCFHAALHRAMNDCLAVQNIHHEACPPGREHEDE